MNTALHDDIYRLVHAGKIQSQHTKKNVLISSVTRINMTDPIDFYEAGSGMYSGNRFFWVDAKRNITFVGLGLAMKYVPSGISNRYQSVNNAWQEILKHAIVTEDAPEHAGPIFFGGFSFDPENKRTKLWSHFPQTLFMIPQYMLTVTNDTAWLTTNQLITPDGDHNEHMDVHPPQHLLSPAPFKRKTVTVWHKEEIHPSDWLTAVEQAAKRVQQQHLDKVVLARELRLYARDSFAAAPVIERLILDQPDSYIFAFEQGDDCFIGATPERLIKKKGIQFLSTSLAGSIARSDTETEDTALGQALLKDGKNLLEHSLAVQMIKEAMGEVCENVQVHDHPILYRLKDIQHLYTPVTGQAKPGASILQAVEALHPTPALGGFPQREAVQLIRELEHLDRGWYAAPLGWINRHQNGEFAVAIRSGLLQGNEASLFAGCGIVGDSIPLDEYQETKLKFRPMLSALRATEHVDRNDE